MKFNTASLGATMGLIASASAQGPHGPGGSWSSSTWSSAWAPPTPTPIGAPPPPPPASTWAPGPTPAPTLTGVPVVSYTTGPNGQATAQTYTYGPNGALTPYYGAGLGNGYTTTNGVAYTTGFDGRLTPAGGAFTTGPDGYVTPVTTLGYTTGFDGRVTPVTNGPYYTVPFSPFTNAAAGRAGMNPFAFW